MNTAGFPTATTTGGSSGIAEGMASLPWYEQDKPDRIIENLDQEPIS